MQQLTFKQSTIALTSAISLLSVAALLLLVCVATYWTWQWFAPLPEVRAASTPSPAVNSPSSRDLFGKAAPENSSAAPTRSAIRLLGIVAATGERPGYAVLRLEPRQIVTVREGAEITPGLRLAEVGAGQVILERGGIRETLAWPEKNTAAEALIPRLNQ